MRRPDVTPDVRGHPSPGRSVRLARPTGACNPKVQDTGAARYRARYSDTSYDLRVADEAGCRRSSATCPVVRQATPVTLGRKETAHERGQQGDGATLRRGVLG